eukprot:3328691-Amphidinium_carterae.1
MVIHFRHTPDRGCERLPIRVGSLSTRLSTTCTATGDAWCICPFLQLPYLIQEPNSQCREQQLG